MKKEFKIKEKCPACKGTGIYIGMGERDGIGIVCYKCEGTGCFEFVHEYEDFEKRAKSKAIHVLQTNPGISVGVGNGYKLTDFGGMSYNDWVKGKPFPKGSEMRMSVCPAWWYQSVNYKLKPNWDDCIGLGSFSSCRHFPNKEKCWKRFDNENN